MIVFIDSGVLGLLSSPNEKLEVQQCQEWLYSLLSKGVYIISSDLCDYEVRRSLLLNSIRGISNQSIDNLNNLDNLIDFLPTTKSVMQQAAQLWATSRFQGTPTANPQNIDVDVIIAAQCQLMQAENPGQNLIVATTNVKHLSRFVNAQKWFEIRY